MKYIAYLFLSSVLSQEIFKDPENIDLPEPDLDLKGASRSSSSKFTCDSAVSRLFTQPFDKLDEYFEGSSNKYTDYTFYYKDQLYWEGFTPRSEISKFGKKGFYWNRLTSEYPRATLWGREGVSWDDAN